jgi:hypothetical protein
VALLAAAIGAACWPESTADHARATHQAFAGFCGLRRGERAELLYPAGGAGLKVVFEASCAAEGAAVAALRLTAVQWQKIFGWADRDGDGVLGRAPRTSRPRSALRLRQTARGGVWLTCCTSVGWGQRTSSGTSMETVRVPSTVLS